MDKNHVSLKSLLSPLSHVLNAVNLTIVLQNQHPTYLYDSMIKVLIPQDFTFL